jgi:hypothetical protein
MLMTEARSSDQLAELAHEEAVRSIGQQRASLDELRTRTGSLLAAANIATAFLGGVAAKGRGKGFPAEFWIPVVLFVLVGVLSVWILLPRSKWTFSYRVSALKDSIDPNRSGPDLRLAVAEFLQEAEDENEHGLRSLFRGFQFAGVLLIAEVVAWVIIIV